MRRKYLILSFIFVFSIPLWLWAAWLLTPKKKLVIAIIDKTQSVKSGSEHLGLTWVLNYEKYGKTKKLLYNVNNDYFGLFNQPKASYRIKGLERFSSEQIDQLSVDCDAAYYVDTYGVYKNDLTINKTNTTSGGILYGGLAQQDIDFLKKLKSRKKLILSEYNILAQPTAPFVKQEFEGLFGIHSSGWVCRYFNSLDPRENKDLPNWLINQYKGENNGEWPFTKAGLVFVKENENIVILEDKTDVADALPYVTSTSSAQTNFQLPASIKFPFWFDIIEADTAVNNVAASFDLSLTNKGLAQLNAHHIPTIFPAVVMHKASDYEFYYFAGSFCAANSVNISSSHFKGITAFKNFLYNDDDAVESTSFFWNFYQPLLTNILKSYYKTKRS